MVIMVLIAVEKRRQLAAMPPRHETFRNVTKVTKERKTSEERRAALEFIHSDRGNRK